MPLLQRNIIKSHTAPVITGAAFWDVSSMKSGWLQNPGRITGTIYINNRLLFPVSWLNKQEYCEYQIYLEHIAGIKVEPTRQMAEGKREHETLYEEFKKEAVPSTIDQMLSESRKISVLSRELSVRDIGHGIYGMIDEVLLTPDAFIVIDDKPGTGVYLSSINQVYGYCLAFKYTLAIQDNRPVIAALRERGTDNIFWHEPFDLQAEKHICTVIERIHSLLNGNGEFTASDNPNKCRACRFRTKCDRSVI